MKLYKEKEMTPRARRAENKFWSIWLKGCTVLLVGAFLAGFLNVYINASHAKEIVALEDKVTEVEAVRKEAFAAIEKDLAVIEDSKEANLMKEAIDIYFERNNAGVLKWSGDAFVAVSRLYWLNPFRMAAIAAHETRDKKGIIGNSYAARVQNNICGMNWPSDELKLLKEKGYNPDVFNVKVYGSIDECIMSQGFKLKTLYKDHWGLETLSEIQTRWAPESDPRQGLAGMDNTIWTESTINIFREIEAIYEELGGFADEE